MPTATTPSPDIVKIIIDSSLSLAVEFGWRHVALSEVAERAGLSEANLLRHLPSKSALFEMIVRDTDAQVLTNVRIDEDDGSARERLFDVLMARFDILAPRRLGIAAILRDGFTDPLTLGRRLCCVTDSMKIMLETAQIPTSGPFGALRIKGSLALYAATFRVWLQDDSQDMAKTMASLDKALIQVEKIAGRIPA